MVTDDIVFSSGSDVVCSEDASYIPKRSAIDTYVLPEEKGCYFTSLLLLAIFSPSKLVVSRLLTYINNHRKESIDL